MYDRYGTHCNPYRVQNTQLKLTQHDIMRSLAGFDTRMPGPVAQVMAVRGDSGGHRRGAMRT